MVPVKRDKIRFPCLSATLFPPLKASVISLLFCITQWGMHTNSHKCLHTLLGFLPSNMSQCIFLLALMDQPHSWRELHGVDSWNQFSNWHTFTLFQSFAKLSNAVTINLVHMPLCTCASVFAVWIPRSGNTESKGVGI